MPRSVLPSVPLSARLTAVAAMTAVVVASNILVQYPVEARIGRIDLADLLTWGAFSYPLAFLVTDLTNRRFGAAVARRIVIAGFAVAVMLSLEFATPRIALASGLAFLIGQLLDVTLFDRLRRAAGWWKAPFVGSVVGSITDTTVFFSLAFAPVFGFIAASDAFAVEPAPFLGSVAVDMPRWLSWAVADLSVKLLFAVALLVPYRLVMNLLWPMPTQQTA
ncbi:MAG: VUT family protein [Ancalomicrobiaceae bacterium]|nr:VUT family protein [Ancalomicrobiaceae bacterium]